MKKILLATSALAAIASFGASAHVRDGLVETSKNRVELAITGEISVLTGFTSFETEEYDMDGNAIAGVNSLDYSTWGQNYTADIDFVATTHVRDWEIKGVIELDVSPAAVPTYMNEQVLDANGAGVVDAEGNPVYETVADYSETKDKGYLSAGKVYVDFTAPYGTFRVGKGSGPADELTLEASIPGYDLEDITGNDDFALTGARFADSFNQIGYYSPVWNGFQFGIAYGFMENTIAGVDSNDLVELAAVYKGEFNAFSYGVSAAYRTYLGDDAVWDDAMSAGISLGYMGFDWTTTYAVKNAEVGKDLDLTRDGIRTALTYDWDRWSFGAYYEMAEESMDTGLYTQDVLSTNIYGVGTEFDVFDGLVWKFGANFVDFERTETSSEPNTKDYTYRDGSAFQVLTGFDLEW